MTTVQDNPTPEGRTFSIFGSDIVEKPFPIFTQMRAEGPVIPFESPNESSRRVWAVTRLSEAVQVLKDKRFTMKDPTSFQQEEQQATDRLVMPRIFSKSMIAVDDPDHRRLRGLVSKVFTPRYIESLRPHIQMIADELLDRVQDQGNMNLIEDYAYPLPINVISDMLGIPLEHRDQMRHWSAALSSYFSGSGSGSEKHLEHVQGFFSYVKELIEEKKRAPQNDLMSQLIQIEQEGEALNEQELLSTAGLLIFAGHETTSNLIGTGTLMLLDYPDQMQRLKADLSLVPSAVEELLRFNGPAFATLPRFATADIELGGQAIRHGDAIIALLGSANHDESQFTDPESLDIARSLNRHIAFGQGVHVCIGAPLARLEGEIAFTTLLNRMPNLRLNIPREAVTWQGDYRSHRLTSLPVVF